MPPPKKAPQTDAIFEQLSRVNPQADEAPGHAPAVARRQGDGQRRAVLPQGQEPHQDRGGGPRLQGRGHADPVRDLPARARRPDALHGPLEGHQRLHRGPAGGLVEFNRVRFPEVTKLVLNLDNGPENHSRRTQFLKRMVEFA